jgi:hypothetical protein
VIQGGYPGRPLSPQEAVSKTASSLFGLLLARRKEWRKLRELWKPQRRQLRELWKLDAGQPDPGRRDLDVADDGERRGGERRILRLTGRRRRRCRRRRRSPTSAAAQLPFLRREASLPATSTVDRDVSATRFSSDTVRGEARRPPTP